MNISQPKIIPNEFFYLVRRQPVGRLISTAAGAGAVGGDQGGGERLLRRGGGRGGGGCAGLLLLFLVTHHKGGKYLKKFQPFYLFFVNKVEAKTMEAATKS